MSEAFQSPGLRECQVVGCTRMIPRRFFVCSVCWFDGMDPAFREFGRQAAMHQRSTEPICGERYTHTWGRWVGDPEFMQCSSCGETRETQTGISAHTIIVDEAAELMPMPDVNFGWSVEG